MILAGARLYVPAVVLNLILEILSKAAKDAQRQNIPPPGAAVGGEWIETPGCCCGTSTVYAANGVEYWCPDRSSGDAIMYACENSGDY